MKVTVVNYDIGNILSVERAFTFCGADVTFAESEADILKADRLVVPGVGAFSKCMRALDEHGMRDALLEFAGTGRPYMGICVGMQMLMDESHEFGNHAGLGLIPGRVEKMQVEGERIPFIGWKHVELWGESGEYYFVHSYHALPDNAAHLLATYSFGDSSITAAVQRENVVGFQFHPEKSADDGLSLIKRFLSQ